MMSPSSPSVMLSYIVPEKNWLSWNWSAMPPVPEDMMSLPLRRIEPVKRAFWWSIGDSLPKKRWANTDFPQATGPVIPVIVPFAAVKVMSVKSGCLSAKENDMCSTRSSGDTTIPVTDELADVDKACSPLPEESSSLTRYGLIRFHETVAFCMRLNNVAAWLALFARPAKSPMYVVNVPIVHTEPATFFMPNKMMKPTAPMTMTL